MHDRLQALTRSLFLTAVFSGLAFSNSPAQAQNYPQSDVPPPAARLLHLQGNISVQPNGVDQWGGAGNNQPIGAGDRIYSDQDGQGELQASGVRAYFASNTDITLTNIDDRGVELGVASGSAVIIYDDIVENQSLFVSTPNGGITLQGRGYFRIDVYPEDGATIITNARNSDTLLLNGAGEFSYTLYRGQSLQVSGTNPVYAQPVAPAPEDPFGHWSGNIESQRYNSISARYVNREIPGYDTLDDAGDWQPDSDYGPIWFPRVEAGWAPYHNGHWVNRPFYGWTWVADEPWGAAPFHYGRWVQIRGRWAWIPGPREVRPVWSPAQVAFAGGVNIGGIGVSVWVPLGPGEPYRPWYPCSPQYIDRVNISNIRETRVVHVEKTYVNIVNVTNVTNITYVNRTSAAAMRPDDFAAGHNAKTNFVRVDTRQVEHFQPAAPTVRPPAQPIILRPVARPSKVPDMRPVLINQKGQQAPAAPNAKPVPVPVKVTPPVAPRPIAGHAPIGSPVVNGKPVAPAPAPAPAPNPARPTPQPVTPPAPVTPANPGANKPLPPTPGAPVRPDPVRPDPVRPDPARPNPVRPDPARPDPTRPTPPAPAPVNPVRPQPPIDRTLPAPTPVTPVRPAPPAEKIPPQPTPPPGRPQPVVPPTRPVTPQPRPAQPDTRPVPPATRPVPPTNERPAPRDDKKKDDKKKEDKRPPQKPE
jgi:hypothetical protein